MKTYLLLEKSSYCGEIARFENRKEALKAMLKYNLEQSTYNQWAKSVNKYGFPLVKVQVLYGFNSKN